MRYVTWREAFKAAREQWSADWLTAAMVATIIVVRGTKVENDA